VTAVRQIETLVAKREVRDLLVAKRNGQPRPVVERRVDDLVTRKTTLDVSDRHVADFAAPPFDQRDDNLLGLERSAFDVNLPVGKSLELLVNE
jgi:hypothetical protein